MVPTLTSANVPYYSSPQILSAIAGIDPTATISDAYTTLYDSSNPPVKHVLPGSTADAFTLVMPYENKRDGLYFEKVLFIDKKRRPGIAGYASIYNLASRSLLAVMDAMTLTGYRTAAKSLLFAKLYFQNRIHAEPKEIHIYGSSTQAFFHALLFSRHYNDAVVSVIVRTDESRQRVEALLNGEHLDGRVKVLVDMARVSSEPDIIVTTTASQHPFIGAAHTRSVPLIIAVGSSSGQYSEVDLDVVMKSNLYVDSRISIDGKGELKIPLDRGLIDRSNVRELVDVLIDGAAHVYGSMPTTLFVSKGLIIEDYAFALKLLDLK